MRGAAIAALLAGCGGDSDAGSGVPGVAALEGDDVVWCLPITTAPSPVPAWVAAPIPPDPLALPAPEAAALIDRVCRGLDPTSIDQVAAVIAADPDAERGWTAALLERCRRPGPAFCAEIGARAAASGPTVEPGLFALWHVAGGCTEPGLWPWIRADGGSLFGAVDYLAGQDNLFRPVLDPSIPARFGGVLANPDVHRDHALQVIAAVDHPDSARLLLEDATWHDDPEARDAVLLWLYRQSDPAGRAAFEGACARHPDAWQCAEALAPLDDLPRAIVSGNTDLGALIARYPGHRTAILSALGDCVANGAVGGADRGARCLAVLAGAGAAQGALDRLEGLEDGDLAPLWAVRRAVWRRHGVGDGVPTYLASLDLVPADVAADDAAAPPVFVADWMVQARRGVLRASPPDAWLRALLAQVPELHDAVVEARTARWEGVGDPELVEVLVWLDGVRLRATVPAADAGREVAGLANTLAERRGLDRRFALVAPGDLVIHGTQAGLRTLVADGMIELTPRGRPAAEPPAEPAAAADFQEVE